MFSQSDHESRVRRDEKDHKKKEDDKKKPGNGKNLEMGDLWVSFLNADKKKKKITKVKYIHLKKNVFLNFSNGYKR